MPNELAEEISPYLLQHAGNPVDWHPWCAEALELARLGQKPIFLSIGYSACHWCHVMAHESFENPRIAGLLNEGFVSIKVDREERPELDQLYMEAVQAMTGRGGWPLSVFLTPSLEPFFGGTYWPPHNRLGMPGFDRVLAGVRDAWLNRRQEVLAQAAKVTEFLRDNQLVGAGGAAELDDRPLAAAAAALVQSFDPQFGGFGGAPKFPQPIALRLLLRCWRHSGGEEILNVVTTTLDRMAAGGMYDHLGGGFHRYSVDARWLVPHFEKMLYDNALLAGCYLEAWQATGNPAYARTARETLDYVLRDMTDPQGGFYSSEDADSEGEEGKFYLWTPAEVEAVLGPRAAGTFCRVYDVTESGNFEGRNILNLSRPIELYARMLDRPADALEAELADARGKLLAARAERVRPGRDDKVLVSWNGLLIDALARAGAALQQPRYTAAAIAAAEFLWNNLRDSQGRLLHCWRNGRAKHAACLDDYASQGNALLTLYEMVTVHRPLGTGPFFGQGTLFGNRRLAENMDLSPSAFAETQPRQRWLDAAAGLADEILARFADPEHGGFFFTASDHEPLVARKKDVLDSSLPSGNGLAATLLVRLGRLSGRDDYLAAADRTLRTFAEVMQQMPTATGQLLLALDEYLGAPRAASEKS
jgi:hypothetical protein